ncbi:carboxypeptidase regulatory-like domain-containing protein [Candidatus Bipolaricaulota bacterium]
MKTLLKGRRALFLAVGVLLVAIITLTSFIGPAEPASEEPVGSEAGTVQGMVLDAKGNPVPDATVQVEGQTATAATASDGSFTLAAVEAGSAYLYVTSPSAAYLDGETLESVSVQSGLTVSDVKITLSGRPSDQASFVGMQSCVMCHGEAWSDMFDAFDGTKEASAHSRFMVQGTDQMVYPDMWPEPGDKVLPRDTKGNLLMVQDPQDGEGLVNVVLCTRDNEGEREYLFKFYPESDRILTESDLDGSGADGDIFAWKDKQDAGTYDPKANPIFIPVAATNGGQGNWGEGWADPNHEQPDSHPNFGEGKQRYMCRMQDVPSVRQWAKDNDVTNWLDDDYIDYIPYMPVYLHQDGTPADSDALGPNDVATPKFMQKSPTHWAYPENTMSRNCAGCHATGARIVKEDIGHYTQVVTDFEYKDFDITCERCHGPGSEHAASADNTKIILPQYLTAKAGNELCGQCHGSHAGKSATPEGIHKYPYDGDYENSLGNGFFVPGVYDIEDFYFNYDQPTSGLQNYSGTWKEGTFHSWPDQTHARAHSQMLSEMRRSVHYDNPLEKLTCYTCHDAHTLGAPDLEVDGVEYEEAAYNDNTLCLACHATRGQFEDITKEDVLNIANADPEGFVTRNTVARVVAAHMEEKASMGVAPYTPTDETSPVGRCTSCHMAKISKLQDVKDDAQWHLALDADGKSAVAEGDVGSHVFDIVWPGQSSVLVPFATKDADIMPNSCSNCHDSARFSGDSD